MWSFNTSLCGICGFVYREHHRPIHLPVIQQMNQTIVHRGPDSEGYHTSEGVALAMRRLSIIDVAGGEQPIYNEDKTLAIVFNGEIYNYPELRARLLQE